MLRLPSNERSRRVTDYTTPNAASRVMATIVDALTTRVLLWHPVAGEPHSRAYRGELGPVQRFPGGASWLGQGRFVPSKNQALPATSPPVGYSNDVLDAYERNRAAVVTGWR